MEVREVQDPRLVGGTVSNTGEGKCQKTSQGGEGVFHTSTVIAGIGLKGGHSPGPPALPCLCRKRFIPPANSIFACRDIQEIPREKVVAYTRALPCWAEQNNPPARGEPHLLVRSVLELREEVKWYLSFTNEEVFWGVALPKEEGEESLQTPGPTDFHEAPHMPEPAPKRRTPKFVRWEKVLHPSQPVVAP